MQVSLKTKADLDFILHFVDDRQAAAVEWLKPIGTDYRDGLMSRDRKGGISSVLTRSSPFISEAG